MQVPQYRLPKSRQIEYGFRRGPFVNILYLLAKLRNIFDEKVQVGKDQEKVQSEKDSHSKSRGGKNKPTIWY